MIDAFRPTANAKGLVKSGLPTENEHLSVDHECLHSSSAWRGYIRLQNCRCILDSCGASFPESASNQVKRLT